MSEILKDLRSMPIEKLIEKHDQLAQHTVVGTTHYLDEISRRDTEKATNKIVILTKWIAVMTFVMMAATIVNIILFIQK